VTGPLSSSGTASASTASTSTTASTASAPISRGLVAGLVLAAASACIVVVLLVLPWAHQDPYTRQTLELQGSVEHGALLFRLNCAGCHGIAAQGLVGPDLHGVAERKNQRQLIQQVVSGRTPPMPRFQPEPQAMADLLAYLNGLV
jgi:mono/diheme cytochrome c family protein